MKKFTTTFFLLMAMVLLLPTEMKATDYYLIGDFNKWNETDTSYKFTVNGKTATAQISAAAFSNNGTDNDGVCFAVNAIGSSSNRWYLRPSEKIEITEGSKYSISSDYNNNLNNSFCFKNPATSSTEIYTITLDFSYSNDINHSNLTITKSGSGGGETGTGYYLYCSTGGDWSSASTYCVNSDNELKSVNGKYNVTFTIPASTSKFYFCVFNGDELKWSNAIRPNGTGDVTTTEGTIQNTSGQVWKPTTSSDAVTYKLVLDGFTDGSAWTLTKVTAPSVTYTLTYGDNKSVTGKVSGNVYTFGNIPHTAFGGTETVKFQLKSEESGTTTYYNMPDGTKSINAATEYTAETNASGSDWTYTRANVPNRGNFKVTLNTVGNKVTLTDNTFIGTEPETGDDYYIFGDWNNWKAKDAKRFKMQPVYGQKGVYSMYINTPVNLNGNDGDKYALKFCVSSGKNIDENITADNTIKNDFWSHVFRPNGGSKTIERNNITSGEAAEQSGDACWILKKNVRTLGSGYANGGCYLFTIDTNTGDWTIKSLENVRVIYFLREENGYVFNGEYLVDGTEEKNSTGTDYTRNPNNNYTGLLKMEKGSHYLLSDGYHTFGSKAGDIDYNSQSSLSDWNGKNQPYQKINESATLSGNQNMPFNMESKTYYAEANVVVMNNDDETGFDASDKRILWYDGTGYGGDNEKTLQVWFKHGDGNYELMTYDEELHTWVTKGVALDDEEKYQFKESRYDGNGNIVVETPELSNTHEGTFKAVYVDQYTAGTEKPIYDVLLSVDLTYPNEDVFIRTFSDYEPRLIPDGLTAYYATGYNQGTKTVNLKSIEDGIIPAYTGVIIVYDGLSTGINFDPVIKAEMQTAETVSMRRSKAAGNALRRDGTTPFGYGEADGGIDKNWLVTDLKHDKESHGPIDRNESNTITYRNYYLANMDIDRDGKKTLGFYRVKAEGATGNKNVRKAYLAMPSTMQIDPTNDDLQDNTTLITAAKRVTFLFDGGFDSSTPTAIKEINNSVESNDNSFYNLQGMKVSKPSKGIYIYRGRKVIIK